MLKQKYKAFFLSLLVMLCVFVQGVVPVFAKVQSLTAPSEMSKVAETVPGEIVVKLSNSIDLDAEEGRQQLTQIAEENKVAAGNIDAGEDNVAVFKTSENVQAVQTKIQELSADPRVEYAQPNFVYHSMAILTNDPQRGLQWALDNSGQIVNGTTGLAGADINAPEAWSVSEGAVTPPIVAVLDDGANYNHNDLLANMWNGSACVGDDGSTWGGCAHGYDFFANDKDPAAEGSDAHGTVLAGIIGMIKNNNLGGVGIAHHAILMPLRIGSGESFTTDKAIRAINFAKNNGAKIINASWGGAGADLLLKNTIESFNGLFVTSAGNSGSNNDAAPIYPCNFDSPNIVCVAATDQNDNLWSSSNFGAASVDLAAPGVNIFGPSVGGPDNYALGEGTSMATPLVAGTAALLWGRNNALTAAQIKTQILGSGDSLATLAGKTVTGRRLNVYAALGGTGIALENNAPFAATSVKFSGKDVQNKKTTKEKVKLNFDNAGNAAQFIVSRRASFAGAAWQPMQNSTKVSLKNKGKAETFYVKFRDTNGVESALFKSKVTLAENPKRKISSSKKSVKGGVLLVQRGKGFSKKSQVALFFGSQKSLVNTDARGNFIFTYRAAKNPGNYSWYAQDLKTGKKSRVSTYKVVR